jgi:hypothetical protein
MSRVALLLVLAAACGREPRSHGTEGGEGGGGHAHKAPRGGTLVTLGDHEAHLELLLDAEAGVLSAFVLDGRAEKAVRVRQPAIEARIEPPEGEGFDLALAAVARPDSTGETVGDTSEFRGASPRLRGLSKFHIAFRRIEVRGTVVEDLEVAFPEGDH